VILVETHARFAAHDAGRGHPERPARLDAVLAGVRRAGLDEEVLLASPEPAGADDLERVHSPAYLAALEELCATGGGAIDMDTGAGPASWDAAVRAAGAGLDAVARLESGEATASFCAVRPPGHHARPLVGMGFCLLNNVAITAAALAARGERVAIVDIDAHHGNGTQEAFYDDPRVLFVSFHQWPLYPGTGRPEERGSGLAYGTTVNLPMPPGTSGDSYRALFDEVITPSVARFGATWVLVSAGFDAHRDDPLGDMRLTAGDYADLTRRAVGLSGPGRLVLFLEGGYSLPAVRASVAACAAQLADSPLRPEPLSRADDGGRGRVDAYRRLFVEDDALA
jgi:acetoin utilization deacetylase AcuC-like enzyme